jgi:hypothetical protein
MAKKARVLLMWQKSISTDVISQHVSVASANQDVFADQDVPASTQEFTFDVPEKTLVHVEVTAFDGTHRSDPAVLDFEIQDLTAPQPITDLTYEVVEVFDDIEPIEDTTPLV